MHTTRSRSHFNASFAFVARAFARLYGKSPAISDTVRPWIWVRLLTALATLGVLGGCDPQLGVDPAWANVDLPSAALAVSDSMADVGAELFRRNCAACHSLGGGDVVGPDLSGVTTRRPIEWIRGMVARPDSMLRVDGVAQALLLEYQVPMLNRELDQARVRAILEFLWRADHGPGTGMGDTDGR